MLTTQLPNNYKLSKGTVVDTKKRTDNYDTV